MLAVPHIRVGLLIAAVAFAGTVSGCATGATTAPASPLTLSPAQQTMDAFEKRIGCEFEAGEKSVSVETLGSVQETCPIDGAEVDLVYFESEDAYTAGYEPSRTHVAYYEHEFAAASDDAAVIARIEAAFASW